MKSTMIQQTLTQEPLMILNRSITEASRRNHAQTTPLHVAATLLSSPTGILRQACLKSHPNSSHPLQCRALDLCFRVALERLPSSHRLDEPPLSNALTAALKRAQAHQRRGSPENHHQQPLLAVKVEIEQLIISILDDPSVSKVMREASFSSPAVKAAIEQSMMMMVRNSSSSPIANLQQGSDEVKRVIEIMMRRNKRNPILVGGGGGDEEPAAVMKEVVRRIEKEGLLRNAEVIRFLPEKMNQIIPSKIKELGYYLIESRIRNSNNRGIVLDLGDLKWLVEEGVSENARAVVAEMRNLILSIGEEDDGGLLWLIGTANCETYLRCQVYHVSLERDWDVQAVPIASKSSSSVFLRGIIPSRVGTYGNHNPYINPLIPLKRSTMALPVLVPDKVADKCCPTCFKNYVQEFNDDSRNSSSEDANRPPPLPRWLQNAKPDNQEHHSKAKEVDEQIFRRKLEEQLRKKWLDKCSRIHPSFHQHYNLEVSKQLLHQSRLQTTTTTILGKTLQLSTNISPPSTLVKTDLVLGPEKTDMDCILGCISSELETETEKFFNKGEDADSFKKLLKGLAEKSWWQKQAVSELATIVTRSRSGNGKRRDGVIKGDLWLLFAGPDRISKKKLTSVLAEQICELSKPIVIYLGSSLLSRRYNDEEEESDVRLRGKTALDRIVEAVKMNPNSVIVLEDIDESDMLVRGSIKSAMERGRLTDSHGREISLGNVIFILTAKPDEHRNVEDPDESKYGRESNWQIRLSIKDRSTTSKRRANWFDKEEEENRAKMKMPRAIGHGLSLDLNLVAGAGEDEDDEDESHNSSDIVNRELTMTTVPHDLAIHLDGTIVFKPVDFGAIRREIERRIKECFSGAVGKEHTIELEGAAIEKLVGEFWFGRIRLDDWMEKLLSPSFEQMRSRFSNERTAAVVQLELDGGGGYGYGSDVQGQVRLVLEEEGRDIIR